MTDIALITTVTGYSTSVGPSSSLGASLSRYTSFLRNAGIGDSGFVIKRSGLVEKAPRALSSILTPDDYCS
jgi:hypothetical protein